MKNKYVLLSVLLVPFIVGMVACNDDQDDDFLGTDNFISKFELTVNEKTYEGSITDDQILVTVPTGLSLNGAGANVVFCEHATIEPEPGEISDWSEELQLMVTAYNGEKRAYTYKPAYSDLSVEGNIVLATQEDVDAFGETGTTVIHGNLTIGANADGESEIMDLSALSNLKEVDFKVTICKSFVGKTLAGLDHLEKAGGLNISGVDSLVEVSLPKLKEVGLEVVVTGRKLEKVTLPLLATVTESLTIKGDSLAEVALPELAVVKKDFTLHGSTGTALTNPMQALSLPKLEEVGGHFSLDYWSNVAQVDMPALKRVAGLLTLNNVRKVESFSSSFPLLEEIGGFSSADLRAATEFSLPALKRITGYKDINGNETSGFVFRVYRSGYLEMIDLPLLEEVTGNFSMTYFYNLAEKNELNVPNLRTITGTLELTASSSAEAKFNDLSSLSNLRSVDKISIRYFSNLYDFTPLSEVFKTFEKSSQWSVLKCGYTPTYADMEAGNYKPVD